MEMSPQPHTPRCGLFLLVALATKEELRRLRSTWDEYTALLLGLRHLHGLMEQWVDPKDEPTVWDENLTKLARGLARDLLELRCALSLVEEHLHALHFAIAEEMEFQDHCLEDVRRVALDPSPQYIQWALSDGGGDESQSADRGELPWRLAIRALVPNTTEEWPEEWPFDVEHLKPRSETEWDGVKAAVKRARQTAGIYRMSVAQRLGEQADHELAAGLLSPVATAVAVAEDVGGRLAAKRRSLDALLESVPPGLPPMPHALRPDRAFHQDVVAVFGSELYRASREVARSSLLPERGAEPAARDDDEPLVVVAEGHSTRVERGAVHLPFNALECPRRLGELGHEAAHAVLLGAPDEPGGPMFGALAPEVAWLARRLQRQLRGVVGGAPPVNDRLARSLVEEALADAVALRATGPHYALHLLMEAVVINRWSERVVGGGPAYLLCRAVSLWRVVQEKYRNELEHVGVLCRAAEDLFHVHLGGLSAAPGARPGEARAHSQTERCLALFHRGLFAWWSGRVLPPGEFVACSGAPRDLLEAFEVVVGAFYGEQVEAHDDAEFKALVKDLLSEALGQRRLRSRLHVPKPSTHGEARSCLVRNGIHLLWELALDESLALVSLARQGGKDSALRAKALRRALWRQGFEVHPLVWCSMWLRQLPAAGTGASPYPWPTAEVPKHGFFGMGIPFALGVSDLTDALNFSDLEQKPGLVSLGYADRLYVYADTWPDHFLDEHKSNPLHLGAPGPASLKVLDRDFLYKEDVQRLSDEKDWPHLGERPKDLLDGPQALVLLPQFLLGRGTDGSSMVSVKELLQRIRPLGRVRGVLRTWSWSDLAVWLEHDGRRQLGEVLHELSTLACGDETARIVWSDTTFHYRPWRVNGVWSGRREGDAGVDLLSQLLDRAPAPGEKPKYPLAFTQQYWLRRGKEVDFHGVAETLDGLFRDGRATCRLHRSFDGRDAYVSLSLDPNRYPAPETEVAWALRLQHALAVHLKKELNAFEVATRISIPFREGGPVSGTTPPRPPRRCCPPCTRPRCPPRRRRPPRR